MKKAIVFFVAVLVLLMPFSAFAEEAESSSLNPMQITEKVVTLTVMDANRITLTDVDFENMKTALSITATEGRLYYAFYDGKFSNVAAAKDALLALDVTENSIVVSTTCNSNTPKTDTGKVLQNEITDNGVTVRYFIDLTYGFSYTADNPFVTQSKKVSSAVSSNTVSENSSKEDNTESSTQNGEETKTEEDGNGGSLALALTLVGVIIAATAVTIIFVTKKKN